MERESGGLKIAVGFGIDSFELVNRVGSMIVVLSIVGTCFPGEISPASAREVCDMLVHLLKGKE